MKALAWTYHLLKHLRNLPYSKFESQADSFLAFFILILGPFQQLLGFFLVRSVSDAAVASKTAILVDYPQTDNLVAILDQFFNEPLYGGFGIVIVVSSAEKSAGSLRVVIVFVFGANREGIVGGIAVVEGVKGDSSFVGSGI